MSFTGHLEDLAIVDVIQLLHSARKSGTLCVQCGDRESQLVFSEGYIISANHFDSSVRIGKILVDQGSLSQETLDQALERQQAAGDKRKPLIGMLIESGQVSREKAFKGLEHLIEMTIVEMVSWTRGIFTLDVDQIIVSDEYRYFPETLKLDLSLDTQMLLMDALRIFDEKKRDGEIVEPDWSKEPPTPARPAAAAQSGAPAPATAGPAVELSADDLGLEGIEELETRIPEVFTVLKTFDPADIHRQELAQAGDSVSAEQSEELVAYLAGFASRSGHHARRATPSALLLVSHDQLLRHQLMTVCKADGVAVFVVASGEDLFARAEAALARGMRPLVVFDVPAVSGPLSAAALSELRRTCRQRYAQLPVLQLVSTGDDAQTWQAYRDGAQAVIARPAASGPPDRYAKAAISFLEAVRAAVRTGLQAQAQLLFKQLNDRFAELARLNQVPPVALVLLQAVAEQFPRALTLVVRKTELVAERGVGLTGADRAAVAAPALRIPLERPSLLRRAVESGEPYFGAADEPLLREALFAVLGAPRRPEVLLLPLVCRGRTLCLTYADFGTGETAAVQPEALQALARHAGLVLDNALYRRQTAPSA